MKWFLSVVILTALFSPAIVAGAQKRSPPVIRAISDDQLGESLKKFRLTHKGAKCHRRPTEESSKQEINKEWLLWVDCGLESGVTYEGQGLLAEADPAHPFGMVARFYKEKLFELTYALAPSSMQTLVSLLDEKLGKPSQVVRKKEGGIESATWANKVSSLTLDSTLSFPAVADGDFLRVTKSPAPALSVRIFLNKLPASD
jgi:hypothetical protein